MIDRPRGDSGRKWRQRRGRDKGTRIVGETALMLLKGSLWLPKQVNFPKISKKGGERERERESEREREIFFGR